MGTYGSVLRQQGTVYGGGVSYYPYAIVVYDILTGEL